MNSPLIESSIPGLPLFVKGKVREVYDLGTALLIVASDRISAYDSVMPTGIPDKGAALTRLSRFWFLQLRPYAGNHFITSDIGFICARLAEIGIAVSEELRDQLRGRSMMALKTEVFPVECVVRGYLAGSLWNEYVAAGGTTAEVVLHDIPLYGGMRESEPLPEPIFTPATKAQSGHDENISFGQMAAIVGAEAASDLRRLSLDIYKLAAERAMDRGIIIADTKFEFGTFRGDLTLVDEVLTPDSSRFWDAATYRPGGPQASFDKQYLRDWLTQSGWNREPPAPELPPDVVRETRRKYLEAYRRLTGEEFS